ncbi:RNA polymerase sigma factor [Brevibacillus massiliensis]|uniref:RNA polymerase sigma factor n=1 Tax=Brevibacillus massiliensis TaxID=1118054 RepID=UPI0003080535|nr:RNA polymerase sigma factor [Brevibacillus massiliensis]
MDRKEQIEQWFVRYSNDVYKFLVYYTGNKDVEDLVQEVFIKAIKAFDTYEGRANPKTWLLTIARNAAIDYGRKRRLLSWLPESLLQNVKTVEKTPEEILNLHEEKRELYEALQQMKPAYREVLILRGIKGLSPKETAIILQWSESKVNTTLHRAVKALKSKVEKQTKGMINNVV